MRQSKQSLRFIASLALLGLVASLLHAHTEPAPAPEIGRESAAPLAEHLLASSPQTQGASISQDDAHHEHSSHHAIDVEACLACRSHHEDDELFAENAAPIEFTLGTESSFFRESQHHHANRLRATGPRAPPALIG